MTMIDKKETCCGCKACVSACPKDNINYESDKEGFFYPQKNDPLKCGNCSVCKNVCFYHNDAQSVEPLEVLACKIKDDTIRRDSSSGGVFSALAEYVLSLNGVVCGAAFDDECALIHRFAEGDDYKYFRKSKYVQSDMKNTLLEAKRYLEADRYVLFCGTPCQIASLRCFLGRDFEKLLCVDFICHGVPSPLMLRAHLDETEKQNGGKVANISFRTKDGVWKKLTTTTTTMRDGTEIVTKRNPFMLGFLQNLYLRPSCHRCAANNFRSGADITIGDYWGAETAHRHFDDDKGISLIMLNSAKGQSVFEYIKSSMDVIEADLNHAIIFNPNIIKASLSHPKRAEFFNLFYGSVPFSKCVAKFTKTYVEIARVLLSPSQVRHIQLFLSKLRGGRKQSTK